MDEKIELMRQKALRELNDFFGTKLDFKMVLLRKLQDADGWVKDKKVFVLDPIKWMKKDPKNTWPQYFALLKHELSHLFVQAYLGRFDKPLYPKWLSEGMAIFLSGQNKFKSGLDEFKIFLDFYAKGSMKMYKEAGFAVESLYKRFGKEKLLKLVKSSSKINSKSKFNKLFQKIYGFQPSYVKFNELTK
jgi:hypothetical protein